MNVSELSRSNYIKKEDVEPPVPVTIKSVVQEAVKNPRTNKEEDRWIMYFREIEKGLILNVANGRLLSKILKSDESDEWIGKRVVLYNNHEVNNPSNPDDPGGVRIRALVVPSRTQQPPLEPLQEDDSDVPF